MITLDTVAIILTIIGLLTGFIGFMKYVSDRPTRTEMNMMVQMTVKHLDESVSGMKSDLEYIRQRLDKMSEQ